LSYFQTFSSSSRPAAIAVAVIRDLKRPSILDDTTSEGENPEEAAPEGYKELICNAWHHQPDVRPSFLEIMTRLSAMMDENWGISSGPLTSFPSSSSLSSSSSTKSCSSQCDASGEMPQGPKGGTVKPPEGQVTIVFSDIFRAGALWDFKHA